MILPFSAQLQGVVLAVLTGAFLGVLYDAFRIFRVLLQSPVSQVFWCDMFYMALAGLVTFLLSVGVSFGEVRYYIIAGEILGFCIYFFTLGMVSIRIARLVRKVLNFCIFRPISKFLARLSSWIVQKNKKLAQYLKKTFRKPKKRLKRHKHIVYNDVMNSGDRKRKMTERQR